MITSHLTTKEEAEQLAAKIREELPQVTVHVVSINDPKTGSLLFFSLGLFFEEHCILCLDSEEGYNTVKKFCLYVSEQLDDFCSDTHDMSFVL